MTARRNVMLATAGLGPAAFGNRLMADHAERTNPPVGKILSVSGADVHVVTRGVGRAVVFLHGNGGMIQEVEATGLIDMIAQNHRVVVIDRPGFGHSTRTSDRSWTPEIQSDLLVALLDELEITSAVIVAHSWGTMVATALAIHHPHRVAGLVLISGFFYPTSRIDIALAIMAFPVLGDAIRLAFAPMATRAASMVIKQLFSPDAVTQRFNDKYPIALALRLSQMRAVSDDANEMEAASTRLSALYSSITCPTAILAGGRDGVVRSTQSKRLATEIVGATLQIFEKRGHMLPHMEQQAILTAIEHVQK